MAGEVDAERLAAKRWSQRNSDGHFGWSDELGITEQMQAPPSFMEDEHALPVGAVVLTNPELVDGEREGTAVRHVHVYDPLVVEPE